MKKNRGFTLVELLVVIVILGLLMGMVIPAIMNALNSAKVTACKANLSGLYKSLAIYRTDFGGQFASLPFPQRGMAFITHLSATGVDLIKTDAKSLQTYGCPVRGTPVTGVTAIHFFGPAVSIDRVADGDPLASDDHSFNGGKGNHNQKGSNFLFMDGSVEAVQEKDNRYTTLKTKTSR